MATYVNGNIYTKNKGDTLSSSWSSRANPLLPKWHGKGQLYIPPDAMLMWKPTPMASATHNPKGK